jgi:hypothetical protein
MEDPDLITTRQLVLEMKAGCDIIEQGAVSDLS